MSNLKRVFFISCLCCAFFSIRMHAATLAEWTVLVYLQADNNLAPFAEYNIKDMQGGIYANSSLVNILVQWDQPRNNRTWRYKIVKNGRIEDESLTSEMGINPGQEIVTCASWVKRKYPAKKYAFVLWNHGNGCSDARSVDEKDRGILYDYTQNTFLTNQAMTQAFTQMKAILGHSVDIVGMDACMMNMIEVAYQLRGLVNVMVSSEETEPGYGWAYSGFIRPLTSNPTGFDAKRLAQSIVSSYGVFYRKIGETDFTQSAFDMAYLNPLKTNIDNMILLVNECKKYKSTQIKNAVIAARLKTLTFYVSDYVDLYSFYQKFYSQIYTIRRSITVVSNYTRALDSLKKVLVQGLALINTSVVANAVGSRNIDAHGVSIYFPNPTRPLYIDPTYPLTLFAQQSKWLSFIKTNRK
ncbi:MAG: clostripain-related cysteine peptidase [Candidatus Babeliales bacterium]